MNSYLFLFLVNTARGLFVIFSVVGRDTTIAFSFSAISVVWIDPAMNHIVSSIDEKYNENHKIVALLYTDHTKPMREYSKL